MRKTFTTMHAVRTAEFFLTQQQDTAGQQQGRRSMIFWGKRFLSAKTVREFAAGSEKWTLPPPPPPPSYGRSEEKEKEEEEEEEVPLPKVKMERDAISLPPSPEASEK